MSNKIYFKYNDEIMDVIPFLWDPDVKDPPSGARLVESQEDYDAYILNVEGGSTRTRSISIVTGLDAAKALSYQAESDREARCIITEVGDGLYAVGLTECSGSYDDGIPLVEILTEENVECDLDPSVYAFAGVVSQCENRNYEPELLISEEHEYAV